MSNSNSSALLPCGYQSVDDLGAVGSQATLATKFPTIADAKAVYPHATDLNQTLDWAAAQAAVNMGGKVLFGARKYWWSDPVVVPSEKPVILKGVCGKQTSTGTYTHVAGLNEDSPMIHRGTYLDKNGIVIGPLAQGTGCSVSIRDMVIQAGRSFTSCVQLYNVSAPLDISNCAFASPYRGVLLSQSFNATIRNCNFSGVGDNLNLTPDQARQKFGLAVSGHATISECSYQAVGCGLFAFGPQITIVGGRVEMCNHGIMLGGPSLSFESLGSTGMFIGTLDNVMMESNVVGVSVYQSSRVSSRMLTITNNIPGRGKVGLHLRPASHVMLEGLVISGQYTQAAEWFEGGEQPLRYDNCVSVNHSPGGVVRV